MPIPVRRPIAVVLQALLLAASIVACGGSDGGAGEEPEVAVEALLDRAFKAPIGSADLDADVEIQLDGLNGLERPVRIRATGPYRLTDGELPSYDIDLGVDSGDGPSGVRTGRLSTGDRAFVKFEDSFYEVPRKEVEQAKRELRRGGRDADTLKGLGLNARSWVIDAKEEGEEKVGGVDTVHITGRLDVGQLVRGLNRFTTRAGETLGPAAIDLPKPLSASTLARLERVVSDPAFHVYVGKQDEIVRRISASLTLSVPEEERASMDGLEGGALKLTIQFGDVNGDQEIEAPAKAQPLRELTSQLGNLDILSGGLGEALEGGDSGDGSAGTGDSGDDPSSSDGDALQLYTDCLDRAAPDDTEALERCRDLLP